MKKIKIMIIEDSITMRNILFQALSTENNIEIISYASNGKLAIPRIKFYQPEIIILDYEMPMMNGIETIKEIKKLNIDTKIIMFSSYTYKGAEITLQALKEGAIDFVPKPDLSQIESKDLILYIKSQLIPKINELASFNITNKEKNNLKKTEFSTTHKGINLTNINAAGIGISTGGPIILYDIIKKLPKINKNLFIVQHMPPIFTTKLAESLNQVSINPILEGQDMMEIQDGYIYIAPGGYHMKIIQKNKKKYIKLTDDPPRNNCKPSVDYLFESLIDVYGKNILAIIMTGMGNDGYKGIKKVYEMGGYTIAQSPETCTVFGMPKKPIEENLVHEILTPDEIVNRLREALQ
ncbi:MAG: chemotaxis response regulator protein-glutamate methylesterase [Leptospiraceae bacterium]|nr:MAG: chemotaxis response regulator protein-glutamate methylesterase [Leptospiraceae bacterium]